MSIEGALHEGVKIFRLMVAWLHVIRRLKSELDVLSLQKSVTYRTNHLKTKDYCRSVPSKETRNILLVKIDFD